ncbi:cytochrome c biogenesis protein ResB [Calditerricola satsumensis]|uniref:cytochrome c biogenesis protein ResB n=1 Tax=Calditerricola satsumensis TaxID=373054 RepID=UPI00210899DD|nr:cytochrome c biogenesis protein ResB [Calditerricola satsumensis]
MARAPIRVNHPLEHDGLLLYQAGALTEFGHLTLELRHKQTGRSLGTFTVDLHDPAPLYRLPSGATVEILEYFPDFVLNENNEPATKSNVPNNPAFVFQVKTPDKPEGEKSWLFLGMTIEEPNRANDYELKFRDMTFVDVSGLMVRMDRSLPVIFFGCGVVMVGLVMGFYWQHRRIWVQVEGGVVYLAAHTNKNWFGLKKEVLAVAQEVGLPVDPGAVDQGGKRT